MQLSVFLFFVEEEIQITVIPAFCDFPFLHGFTDRTSRFVGVGTVVIFTTAGIPENLRKKVIQFFFPDLYQAEAPDAGGVDDISPEAEREHLTVSGGVSSRFMVTGDRAGLQMEGGLNGIDQG